MMYSWVCFLVCLFVIFGFVFVLFLFLFVVIGFSFLDLYFYFVLLLFVCFWGKVLSSLTTSSTHFINEYIGDRTMEQTRDKRLYHWATLRPSFHEITSLSGESACVGLSP